MQTFIAPYPVSSGRRRASSVPVRGAFIASLLASACFFIASARAGEVADNAADKQAPLLVGLRAHAVTGSVAAATPASSTPASVRPQQAQTQQGQASAKEAPKVAAVTPAPLPAPNAPIPPARPAEYCTQRTATAEAPQSVVFADVPTPPTRPAELMASASASADVTDAQQTAQVFVDAPLPPARPDGLGVSGRVAAHTPETPHADARPEIPRADAPRQDAARLPAEPRRMATRETTVVPGSASPQEPSFFDRLFGRAETPQPEPQTGRRGRRALAYAAQEPTSGSSFFGGGSVLQNASPHIGGGTAVYDISAQTVYLPDGTRLEAHSGLREHRDNPQSVHLRMRGSTPPNIYELTPREELFHGVQALRLNPVAGHTYGRTGLLAHTYMLGPNGDSNGCVSFRDYHAFLRAYQSGQIRRLAVVAHR